MKHIARILLPVLLAALLMGCAAPDPPAQIAAKNNEDGDADAFKNAMPLFGTAMPA